MKKPVRNIPGYKAAKSSAKKRTAKKRTAKKRVAKKRVAKKRVAKKRGSVIIRAVKTARLKKSRAAGRKVKAVARRGMAKSALKHALFNPAIVFTARELSLMRELNKLANQPLTAARAKRIKTIKAEFLRAGK
jgi:hypothetical protein